MKYTEFRDAIQRDLKRHAEGLTWNELRDRNQLPYNRPCPEWTRRLEEEIGVKRVRRPGMGNRLVWTLGGP